MHDNLCEICDHNDDDCELCDFNEHRRTVFMNDDCNSNSCNGFMGMGMRGFMGMPFGLPTFNSKWDSGTPGEGLFTSWGHDGKLICKTNYRNGKLNGLCEYFNENGSLHSIEHYLNGVEHGKSIRYRSDPENHRISYKCSYKYGKRHGIKWEYDSNGKKESKFPYRKGELHGEVLRYDSEERIRVRRTYVDGKVNGLVEKFNEGMLTEKYCEVVDVFGNDVTDGEKLYYQNGVVVFQGNLVMGRYHGTCKWFNDEGKLETERVYDQGGISKEIVENGMKVVDLKLRKSKISDLKGLPKLKEKFKKKAVKKTAKKKKE